MLKYTMIITFLLSISCSIPKKNMEWDNAPKALEKTVLIEQYDGTELQGIGSGAIISPDGWILTNRHVAESHVDNPLDLWYAIHFSNQRFFISKKVILYQHHDLALIKIDAKNLPYFKIRTEPVIPGEPCLAIGNPVPYQFVIKEGIISQSIFLPYQGPTDLEIYIVHTATILPGNSGGPLIDLKGRIIGINTAYFPRKFIYGLSIPTSEILKFIEIIK